MVIQVETDGVVEEECSSCDGGVLLFDMDTGLSACDTDCPDGQFEFIIDEGGEFEMKVCEPCPFGVAECTSYDFATKCEMGLFLFGNEAGTEAHCEFFCPMNTYEVTDPNDPDF